MAKISRQNLNEYGIHEFDAKASGEVIHPEDHEIILYDNVGKMMPREVIIETIQVVGANPTAWGDDKLSAFVDIANQNAFATFVNLKSIFSHLGKIDSLFRKAIDNLHNSKDWQLIFFLLRAHASYLGAVRLATSGQVPEAFMILRGCLENALYGFFLQQQPELIEIWLGRHDDAISKQKVKDEFKIRRMLDLLVQRNRTVGKAVAELYDRTIDYGAHPNERSITSNLVRKDKKDHLQLDLNYLAGDSIQLRMCLKSNAQVGVLCLRVFEVIFETRFSLLGLPEDIKRISAGL